MNYIFTVAGQGSRFLRRGIKPPKPLIRALGQELLIWSMLSFTYMPDDVIYIVSLADHQCKRVSEKLNQHFPGIRIEWIELEEMPNGQLLSACEAISAHCISGPIIIHNCDTSFRFDNAEYLQLVQSQTDWYSIIPVFTAPGSHWSFVKLEEGSNLVASIVEKKRISDLCTIGTYIFRSAENFLVDVKQYIKSCGGSSLLGEFYVAPFIQYKIDQGFHAYSLQANQPRLYGTPDELRSTFGVSDLDMIADNSSISNQRRCLVVDIDGTICDAPANGDYSNCPPKIDVIQELKSQDKSGSYIILFTARNVRTLKGSMGLINKYTAPTLLSWLERHEVPYDEIVFGKPWGEGGVIYIDDKNCSIEEFLSHSL